jgi:hypothetical protein
MLTVSHRDEFSDVAGPRWSAANRPNQGGGDKTRETMRTPEKIEEFEDRAVRAVDRIYDLPVGRQFRAAFGMLFTHPFDGGFPFFLLLTRIALYHLWWEFRYTTPKTRSNR